MNSKRNQIESTYNKSALMISESGSRRSIALLILILTIITVTVVGVTIATLYETALHEERQRLSETAKGQARLIEAVARFDREYTGIGFPGSSLEATMRQLQEAHQNFEGFGETGEFTLAKRDGNQIVFLLNHRHHDLTKPHPIALDGKEAEPMRLALQGKSGSLIGRDYRSALVLAAYEPVAELNLGIVAKIDISEIRQPFIHAGLLAVAVAVLLIIVGAYLFHRIGNTLLRRIEESEEQTRLLLNSTAEAIYGIDLDGKCTFANKACLRLTGYDSVDDFLGKNIHELIHHTRQDGSSYPLEECNIYKSFQEGNGITADDEVFWRSDGTSFPAEYSSYPIKKNGIIVGSVVTFSDIHDRLQAEEEIRLQSEMMKRMSGAVYLTRMDGTIIHSNPEFEKMFGYDPGELLGRNISIVNFPGDKKPEETAKDILDELAKEGSWQGELQNIRKDGTPLWTSASVVAFNHSKYGKVLIVAQTDITEHRNMESALSKSNEKYRLLVENQSDLVVKVNLNGAFQFISPSYCTMFGVTEEELLDQSFMPLVHEDDRDLTDKSLKSLFKPPHTSYHEQRAMTKDGWKWLGWMNTGVLDDNGDVVAIIGVGRDVSERKMIEDKLHMISSAVEQTREAIAITDLEGTIQHVNPAFAELTGYSEDESIGQNPRVLKSGKQSHSFYQQMWQVLNSGKAWQGRVVNKKKDGSFYPALLTISPIKNPADEIVNFVGIQQDLTEVENLEAQLHQAQKMEALGTLIGGIAHEFNNSLAGVIGNLYLAKKEAEQLPSVVKKLETVEKLSFASAELIKSLLSFARKGVVQKRLIPLSLFLKESIKIQRISLPENISVTSDVEAGTMVVEGDANLLQQILMNLINNARDALEGITNPSISITSDTFIASNAFINAHPGCSSKKYVRISIRDNGSGIKPDDLTHVFDPFYTTKEVGKGTGLGLSMAYGAIQTHGGAIEIESVAGIGTLVEIYLPLVEAEVEDASTGVEADVVYGNSETILLVDDNENVLVVGTRILESLNYKVLTATNGQEAIVVFKANKDLIQLVLIDVIMPVLGGIDAVKKLREIKPELKVIFSTGYDRDIMRQSDNMDDETMIAKPFNVSELATLLRNKLDKP